MNYSNELNLVNAEIETLTAQLLKLTEEQTILTQLVGMETKMKELESVLVGQEPEQAEAVTEKPVLSIVRTETVEEAQQEENIVTITEAHISNDLCALNRDINRKSISGNDFSDQHNLPRCYNNTFRSHKRAWKVLMEQFNETTTMYQACTILNENGVSMSSYCSMD